MPGAATDEIVGKVHEFYVELLDRLARARVPFLVGGAYALNHYTGIARFTKDFDIFVLADDRDRVLEILAAAGCRTDVTFPHWLAKAYARDTDSFIDVIYSSGNGIARVDESWFERAVQGEVLGTRVKLVPPEEMIWSKAFIMERERYDGADIAHILRAQCEKLDWHHLLERFADHFRILLVHLVLFGYIYPGERARIPSWVLDALVDLLRQERETNGPADVCRGPILSREQFLIDVQQWGYRDARLHPEGNMSRRDIKIWTDAIDQNR